MNTPNKEITVKKPYNSPQLTVHGDIETITLGAILGDSTDASFTTTSLVGESDANKKVGGPREQFS